MDNLGGVERLRADQQRDQDSIRRDCITAEIDDLDATTTHSEQSIWLSLSEPMRTPTLQNGKWITNTPKFQFKMSLKAAQILHTALERELLAIGYVHKE